MTKRSFCNIFGELFNERHLVPILHDFYACDRALLILTGKLENGDDDFESLLSIIIPKKEADVIKLICEECSESFAYDAYRWNVRRWPSSSCKASNIEFTYIYDQKLVNAFEKIYGGTSYGNYSSYRHISNVMKTCFRMHIEKSMLEPDYYDEDTCTLHSTKNYIHYKPDDDELKLSDLSIVKGKIICDDAHSDPPIW
jgi:hypothetical protein